MQLAAFLCVICAICGRINTQAYSINPHKRNPNVSRRSRRFTQTNNKQQTTKQPLPQTNCLSLRYNAACCIPLRDLRYLRENIHARVLNLLAQMKPQSLPQISLIYADKTTITIPDETHIFL